MFPSLPSFRDRSPTRMDSDRLFQVICSSYLLTILTRIGSKFLRETDPTLKFWRQHASDCFIIVRWLPSPTVFKKIWILRLPDRSLETVAKLRIVWPFLINSPSTAIQPKVLYVGDGRRRKRQRDKA